MLTKNQYLQLLSQAIGFECFSAHGIPKVEREIYAFVSPGGRTWFYFNFLPGPDDRCFRILENGIQEVQIANVGEPLVIDEIAKLKKFAEQNDFAILELTSGEFEGVESGTYFAHVKKGIMDAIEWIGKEAEFDSDYDAIYKKEPGQPFKKMKWKLVEDED